MRVLVTGGSGLVGWKTLTRADHSMDCWFTYYSSEVQHPDSHGRQLDICDREATIELVEEIDPNVVIHSAAMTNVDDCEGNPDVAKAVNVDGVENVLSAAKNVDANFVFLSSAFVFDGTDNPHEIDDIRNPVNVYGATKAEAERTVQRSEVDTAVVRTDQPYGWSQPWQSPTMVEWVLERISDGKNIDVFTDWYNTPTYLPDLADSILHISKNELNGTFHVVGSEYLSRYSWAKLIAKIFGFEPTAVSPVESNSVDIPAQRPNVSLNNSLGQGKSVQQGLKEMVNTRD